MVWYLQSSIFNFLSLRI